jgi:hypothetical protein
MGIHGNATCVMNYDEATGYLIGEENKGLKAMFVMMNEARLGVGLQGLRWAKSPIRTPLPTPGPPAGPLADRCRQPRQEGRPDHRPSRRAPDADDDPRLQRGGARLHAVGRAQIRRRAQAPRTRRTASRPTT